MPRKLICIGLNYRDHAEESELDIPAVPVIFAKWSTSLIGHGETIVIPREETRPDYEGELAIVIGEPVYRATGSAARAAVGAYTCFHDVSGRRAQLETPLRQFTYGKSFDTFGPLGPCLVDAEGVDLGRPAGHDGRLRRDDAGLEHEQPDLRHPGARRVRLARHDARAGRRDRDRHAGRRRRLAHPPRYLREGDVVDISVSGVGTLSNPVTLER